jgi:biotin carboxyl carrier protein
MKKFKFSIDGNKFEVSVEELENNLMEVEVNGSNYTVEIDREGTETVTNSYISAAAPKTPGKVAPIATATPVATTVNVKTVKSQLPGSIIKVLVEVGQSVKRGDVILTIESMKMENSIMAESDGKISKIYVEAGKNIMQDDKLFDLEVTSAVADTKPQAAPAPVAANPKPAPKTAPVVAPKPVAAAPAGSGKPLKSPLPGSIVRILVKEGQAVKRGDTLLTMESMKMENEIKADKDGVVTAIKVTPGQNIMQDDVLLLMA